MRVALILEVSFAFGAIVGSSSPADDVVDATFDAASSNSRLLSLAVADADADPLDLTLDEAVDEISTVEAVELGAPSVLVAVADPSDVAS